MKILKIKGITSDIDEVYQKVSVIARQEGFEFTRKDFIEALNILLSVDK